MKKAVKTTVVVALSMALMGSGLIPVMANTNNYENLNVGLSSYKAGEQTALDFLFDISKAGGTHGLNEIHLFMPLFEIPQTISVNDISINGVKPKSVETSKGGINILLDEDQKTLAFANQLLISIRKEAGIENPNHSGTQQITAFLNFQSGKTITVFNGGAKIERWTPSELPQNASISPAPNKVSTVIPTPGFEVDLSSYKAGEKTSIELEFSTNEDENTHFGSPISSLQLYLPLFNLPKHISTSDISINGVEPESVKVSNGLLEIELPKKNTSLMSSKVLVLIRGQAEVRNPNNADNYSINAYVRFSDKTNPINLKQNLAIQPWSPTQPPDNLVYEPEPKPEPTPAPTPIPETPKEVEVTKDLTVVVQVGSNIGGYKSVIDGKESDKLLTFDVAPFTNNGSTLVPLRFVSEGLGAKVDYNTISQAISLEFGDKKIKLQPGSKYAIVDGRTVELPVAPEVINGTTVVPLRFVSEHFGANVFWSPASKIITVTKTTTEKVTI